MGFMIIMNIATKDILAISGMHMANPASVGVHSKTSCFLPHVTALSRHLRLATCFLFLFHVMKNISSSFS